MKKLLVMLLFVVFALSIANGQFTKIGGGLAYGTGFYHNNENGYDDHKTPAIAFSLTGIYELNLPFHIAPSFTYFFPHVTKISIQSIANKTTVSEMMFDLNGHYVFNSLDKYEFYGIAGLNITFDKIKFESDEVESNYSISDKSNALGLNIGAGTYMKITEQLDIYGEVKYIISKYDQVMVNVGVLLNIDWLKKNENTGI